MTLNSISTIALSKYSQCRNFLIPGRAAPKAHAKCTKDYNAVSYYCEICRCYLQDGGPENKAHISHLKKSVQIRENNLKIALAKLEADTPRIIDKGNFIPFNKVPGMVIQEDLARKIAQKRSKS